MLHRIKLPIYHHILESFLHFQEKILLFACKSGPPLPLQSEQIRKAFPDDMGEWLCSKLWSVRTGSSELLKHLEKLIDFSKQCPTQGQAIIDAFKHDITFPQHIEDANYQFDYVRLHPDTKTIVKPFMVEWYQVLSSGIPHLSSGTVQKFNRQNLVDDFWAENGDALDVCPACDGERCRILRKKVYSDADHFFPESLYPFLSTHPMNLVPICTDCNRYFKHNIDPIDQHQNEPLINIFHPYLRPAIDHILIAVTSSTIGVYQVRLIDKDSGGNSRRLQNLDRLFKLQKLWEEDYLIRAIKAIVYRILEMGAHLEDEKAISGRAAVESCLKQILSVPEKKGRLSFYLLSQSYVYYALGNIDELTHLQSQMEGTVSPYLSSQSFIARSSHRQGTTRGKKRKEI